MQSATLSYCPAMFNVAAVSYQAEKQAAAGAGQA
jgi:hypothetical protein